jgi:AraC-like DNA-binding protein
MSKRLNRVTDWNAVAIDCKFQTGKMAVKCGVSGRTLRRHFLEVFGISLKAWVDCKRASIAAEHLVRGDLVKTTAAELDFSQRSQFSKFFKRVKGSSPTNYTDAKTVHKGYQMA